MGGDARTKAEDRPTIALPSPQGDLIEAVARANAHTIVVLKSGGPVLMP